LVVVTRNNFRRVGCEFGNAWKYVFWSVWFEIRDQLVVNGWIRSQDEEIVNPGGQMQVADKSPHQPSLSDRNDRIVVSGGPYIEILPVDPAFIWVPAYDPLVVFSAAAGNRRGRRYQLWLRRHHYRGISSVGMGFVPL
jgi:hypothetical protein